MRLNVALLACVCSVLFIVGCATTGHPPEITLHDAQAPAWEIQQVGDGLIVALSPAGKSLRLAGSPGLILGTSVDAVVNARYRDEIAEILGEDDTARTLAEGIAQRLREAVGEELLQVWPLTSTVGYANRREALADRYEGLSRQGHDVLLELRASHGVYGQEGTLAVKLEGRQLALPQGRTLWTQTIVVTPEPVLAYDRLRDPTDRVSPQIRGARLTVERGALDKWREAPRSLREDFAATVEAAAAALAVSLALEEDALGEYHLGKWALFRRDFDRSLEHLTKSIQLDAANADAHNALSVVHAHRGQLEEAIRIAKTVNEQWPDYAPAHMNLAWWYAAEKKDAAAARPYYERALALGMEPHNRLDDLTS